MNDKPLRIISLYAENFKRLRAVEICPDPDGNLVVIAGANGAGKTSVLDAIVAALGGTRALPAKPLRDGETKGKIVLNLGEFIVERPIPGEVRVKAANGAIYPGPQAILDALIGKIAFDPVSFMRQAGKDQVKQLLQAVPLGFEPGELDAEMAMLDETFKEWGREEKRFQGALDTLGAPKAGKDEVELSISNLTTEYNELSNKNQVRRDALNNAERLHREFQAALNNVTSIEEQLKQLQAKLKQAKATADAAGKTHEAANVAAGAMPEYDLTELAGRIQGAEVHNAAVRQSQQYYTTLADLDHAKVQRAEYKAKREAVDTRKAKLLAEAQMPVPGLSFDKDQLYLNSIPLEQCSASEQLRVSVAIAMALNPQLRVILIRDGSLLDSTSMQVLNDLATDQGYQVWIERVDESGECGIVIEDGCVSKGVAA